jgi:hypothetical protein
MVFKTRAFVDYKHPIFKLRQSAAILASKPSRIVAAEGVNVRLNSERCFALLFRADNL